MKIVAGTVWRVLALVLGVVVVFQWFFQGVVTNGNLTYWVVGGFAAGVGITFFLLRQTIVFDVQSVREQIIQRINRYDPELARNMEVSAWVATPIFDHEFLVEFSDVPLTIHFDMHKGMIGRSIKNIYDLQKQLESSHRLYTPQQTTPVSDQQRSPTPLSIFPPGENQ